MWRIHRFTLAALLFICPSAWGADLTKVDRTIGKLPQFATEKPEYCLLVFGPDAAKRVWLVQDGGVLYVDRNSNGDLTDPGEQVVADAKSSDSEQEVFSFSVGDIADGSLLHKDLHVYRHKLDHLRDSDPEVREALARNPKFRACSVAVDVEMPSQRGAGIGGRVSQSAIAWDDRGLLQFSSRPEDAPIIHFGGPWTITLDRRQNRWQRTQEVYLVVGTPGIGPGSTADVAFDKVIPTGLAPRLQISFPAKSTGEPAVIKSYDLTRRCCGVNLYGDVAVPEGVGAGIAKVQISLTSWPGADIASSQHEVEIAPAKPGPKLEPVSNRLVSKLEHEHPKVSICGIQFSPDSQRLIAGDYPGGIVHVWDVASGKRLATIDAGEGLRAALDYFYPSPDWQTIFAWQEGKGTFEKIERDGKTLHSVQYHSVMRSWNIDGTPLRTYQQTPPHGIRMMHPAPNGTFFLTTDEVPGEFENSRPRALTLWDTATGENRQLASGNACPGAGPLSSNSRFVAVSVPTSDERYSASIKIFAVPEWKETCTIAFDGGLTSADPRAFAAAGKILAGTARVYDKPDDWQRFRERLVLWDAATGEEVLSIPSESKEESFSWIKASPDGQTIVAKLQSLQKRDQGWKLGPGRLVIVDVAAKTWKTIDFAPGISLGEPLFHPRGKWLVLPTHVVLESQRRDARPEEVPQPKINVIDLATSQTVETLVAPQGFLNSLAFSPDGNTLATSSLGAVLLWDFHQTPGAAALALEQRVGQPMPIVGQTAGGEKFNSDALRGKVVLVDFWATWCRSCVAEIPSIKTMYADLHERGFEVVGISLDDDASVVPQFIKDESVAWPMLSRGSKDDLGLRHSTAVKYGIETLPATFLIGKDGKVAAVNLHGRELREKIESLLDEPK